MNNALPTRMTAISITEPGGPEVLKPVELDVPTPAQGEVLLEVQAAGVNRPDSMQRRGMYPPPPGAPDTPGLEVSGTVVALGGAVANLAVGDSVCALVSGGGYAQYCVASAPLCLPIPKGYSPVQAAALPETFFTVWTNVFERGALARGEHFLVHGGTSGIGTTAIQLAKARGATVYATAGSDEKCAACVELGATAAINYRTEDFVERVKALTDGNGVDLILDMVGGDYLPRNLKCLALEGRLVQIALQRGPKTEMSLLPIMLNRLTVTGSTLRPRTVEQKASIGRALVSEVWPLLESGAVAPVIHAEFPLEAANEAHALLESSKHVGKIMLTA